MGPRIRIAALYAGLYALVKNNLGVNLRGLGWVLRRINRDAVLNLNGVKIYLDHRIATSYGLLVAARPNEPETITLLRTVVDDQTTVVDVGANVGELVLQIAPAAKRVIAFEAHPVAASALRRSVQLNHFVHVDIVEELVGDGGSYAFKANHHNANASAIVSAGDTRSVRLDEQLIDVVAPLVLVIDVEGAEPTVLRGAAETVRRLKPLIVFEYNHVSRSVYSLTDVTDILGEDYQVLRLRRDGRLDADYEHAWNCVAIPRTSSFETALDPVLFRRVQ